MQNYINEAILQKIICLSKQHLNPTLIYLFGSAAQGTMTETSDIDIAFLSNNEHTGYDVLMFSQQLADIANRDVDLIDLTEASTVFRAQIVGTGKLLYCNDENFRHEYEIRVLKEYAMLNEERKEIIDRVIKEKTIYG